MTLEICWENRGQKDSKIAKIVQRIYFWGLVFLRDLFFGSDIAW